MLSISLFAHSVVKSRHVRILHWTGRSWQRDWWFTNRGGLVVPRLR